MLVFRGTNMLVAGPCVKSKEVWVVNDHQNDGNSTLDLVFNRTALTIFAVNDALFGFCGSTKQ